MTKALGTNTNRHMKKEEQIKLTEEIIDTAYRLLINKLAHGGLSANNEAAFQLEFGHILKTVGQLYEFRIKDKFQLEFETYIDLTATSIKSNSERARVDILLKYLDTKTITKAAIELKFFKKANHREPNNRYDVFKDISNLELYKNQGDIDLCYFIISTDHSHYVNQDNYSADTAAFDIRHGKQYVAGTILEYNTKTPYGPNITLRQDYFFNWQTIGSWHYLKLKV